MSRKPSFLKKSDWLTRWVFTMLLSNNNLFMSESFLSLAMFTLLCSPLDPCKLCWKKKKFFFAKDLLLFSMFNFSWIVLDWRPTRQCLYSILYVCELALASSTIGDLTIIQSNTVELLNLTFTSSLLPAVTGGHPFLYLMFQVSSEVHWCSFLSQE